MNPQSPYTTATDKELKSPTTRHNAGISTIYTQVTFLFYPAIKLEAEDNLMNYKLHVNEELER